jgi:hypothetical protein
MELTKPNQTKQSKTKQSQMKQGQTNQERSNISTKRSKADQEETIKLVDPTKRAAGTYSDYGISQSAS